jgi:hypothetical protein
MRFSNRARTAMLPALANPLLMFRGDIGRGVTAARHFRCGDKVSGQPRSAPPHSPAEVAPANFVKPKPDQMFFVFPRSENVGDQ